MVMKWVIIALVVIGAVKVLLTEEYIPEDDIVVGELQTGSCISPNVADENGETTGCKESEVEK